ncbi:MAG: flagellar motor switch phosphatase FliY [Bacillota bacterium]|nr:flagellar motor switch phosphatase FliY [Bacillota bacterium]
MPDMLSQDEIDALLGGASSKPKELTPLEIDALGEIGNISMGTAATTLFTLLNKKVSITTPRVSLTTIDELSKEFFDPSVLIHISYKIGIKGTNLLLLRVEDVRIITDLMMGGDGQTTAGELTDMHLSAINEAMNQMIGSSSTSLSEMLGKKIDISPPEAYYERIADTDFNQFGMSKDDAVVKIAFSMQIGDLIDSEIMQILPYDVAIQMVNNMMGKAEEVAAAPIASPVAAPAAPSAPKPAPPQREPQAQPAAPQHQAAPRPQNAQPVVNAMPVQFENFDANEGQMYYNNDIELIRDVPLEITVELGKTGKRINDILDFGVGTVIELDRLVGEHLDVLANGRRIAKGEVVVVDENYGIRITDIVMPKKAFE